jgi:hypothetical protein
MLFRLCRDDPWREHRGNQIDRHQHIDEPRMAHLGAVVERDVGDVEQRGPKRVRSLRVVIERRSA